MNVVVQPIVESMWQLEVEARTMVILRDALMPKLISCDLRIEEVKRFIGRAT